MAKGPKTDSKTIGGLKVTTTQLAPFDALALSALLLKTAGPAFIPLLPGVVQAAGAEEDQRGAVALQYLLQMDLATFTAGLTTLDIPAILKIAKDSLPCTTIVVDNERMELDTVAKINTAFEGQPLMVLLETIWFSITVNLEGFTNGLRLGAAAASKPAATP